MTQMIVCDACNERFDDEWNGKPMTIKDTTGVPLLNQSELHFCVDCASDVRIRIKELVEDD